MSGWASRYSAADDFGDPRLVVGTEQGRPRRRDDVVAHLLGEGRIVGEPQHDRRIVRKHEIAAIVRAVHDWPYAGAVDFGRRIHMRDEADGRYVRTSRGRRDGCRRIAERVDAGVAKSELAQFPGELAQQHQLFRRARIRRGAFLRLGVVADVAEKAIEDGGHRR